MFKQSNTILGQQVSSEDKLMNKFFRACLFSYITFAIAGPLTSGASFFLRVWMPSYMLQVGLYINMSSNMGSTFNFIAYVIFIKEFRKEVKRLCGISNAIEVGN